MQNLLLPLTKRHGKRRLLAENKLSFQAPESVLSIYDAYRKTSRVGLDAEQLLYCGMVKGKKIMHDFPDASSIITVLSNLWQKIYLNH